MEMQSNIIVIHNPIIEKSELEEIQTALLKISPDLRLEEVTPGAQNNIEWLHPAAVAIFIASGFVNGFLQEIGVDSYQLLKSGFKKILKIGKEKPVYWYSVTSSTSNKVKPATASPSLRITLEIEKHNDRERKISFIFPNDVDLAEAEKAIDVLHKTILVAIERDNNTPNEIAFGHPIPKRVTNYALEPESSEWKELTPDYLYERNLKKQKMKKDGKGKKKK